MIGGSWLVGLTGGIGTGKSRVAERLRELGAAVECADRIVRELQQPGQPGLEAIVAAFGRELLLPSGELDRAALGDRVFRDPEARRRLGELIHPLVQRELRSRLEAHARAGVPVVVADIPLLLEGRRAGAGSGSALPFDVVVLVYAPEALQIERIVARDGLAPEDAERRVRAQLPIEDKRGLADLVIENGGDWAKTEEQVDAAFESWRRRAAAADGAR